MSSNLHLSDRHLSDDNLDEVLMGISSPAASAHLLTCEPCGQRLADFQSAVGAHLAAFNQASLAWSEARSNTITRDIAARKSAPRLNFPALASSTAALVFTFALGLTVGMHHGASTLEASNASTLLATSASQPESSQQADISDDNAMLAAIDSAIVTPQPARFGLYEPTQDAAQASRPAATPQVRN